LVDTTPNPSLVAWRNGGLWTHDSDTKNNFFGIQYDSEINKVFNSPTKKTFETVSQTGSTVWDCPEISTSTFSYGTTAQQSNLVVSDFETIEGESDAALLKDSNSVNGLNDGDVLKGKYIIIKFRAENASNFVFLNSASVWFIDSPLNKR